MTWTAPRTWIASEIVSAAIMNTHVRDDFLETAPAKVQAAGDMVYATAANTLGRFPGPTGAAGLASLGAAPFWSPYPYKAADQTVNNSAALGNDSHLALPLAANEIWGIRIKLFITQSGGSPGIKVALTVPSGASGLVRVWFSGGADAASMTSADLMSATITSVLAFNPGAVAVLFVELDAVVVNGANAGTLQLQWAQSSAAAVNLTVKKGSFMIPTRVA